MTISIGASENDNKGDDKKERIVTHIRVFLGRRPESPMRPLFGDEGPASGLLIT
jgi:hypothetical protein